MVFSTILAASSYAGVKWDVVDESKLPPEGSKTTITISLDIIECAPEKPTEYDIKYPEVRSGTIQADKGIRDKLSRLKKDKDIKILYSTKVTTYPDNKVIVDNRQSLEYLAPEERNGITTFKKEIAYTGNLFEVNPNITKDGNISFTYNFWKGDFQCRISNNKDIPEELGYPINNVNSTNSRATLKDGETIITASMLKNTQTKSHTDAGDIIEKETKAFIYCFGADIKCAQNAPK